MSASLHVRTLALAALAISLTACSSDTPTGPTSRAAATTPPVTPTPAASTQTCVLFGVVTERTSSGSRPVAGLVLEELTCAIRNCPDGITKKVTTAADGAYRIDGLYNGRLNFLWIESTDGYVSAGLRPSDPCDFCDAIVTVNGETQLDLEVVRP